MENRWDDGKAAEHVARYAPEWGEALALRVYTSRLIGSDAALVLHGGGNTSVKDTLTDVLGEAREAIFVKGSGWDLGGIEPQGLPALDLPGLRRLRVLGELSDEEMVNQLRIRLFDAASPNPSVETLLHAFLPHKFVDHSHADAILAISNQEEGQRFCAEALGGGFVALPFIMPGFPLAKAVADAYEASPECEGVLLHQHGLFTFGETARESYDRHIAAVDAAERYLSAAGPSRLRAASPTPLDEARSRAGQVAPLLRGALGRAAGGKHFLVEWRTDESTLEFVDAPGSRELACTPVLTPDHSLRVKNEPFWAAIDWSRPAQEWRAPLEAALAGFGEIYRAYYERGVASRGPRTALDAAPRVIYLPGCGMFASGASAKAASVAADIAEHTWRTKAAASALGPYRGLGELDLFDMEYWSLEQAKLGKARPRSLDGKVAVVTGGGGAIGEGIGSVLAEAGAVVVLVDRDASRAAAVAERIEAASGRRSAYGLEADVTDQGSLHAAFAEVCRRSGGFDVLVPNAGVAHVSSIVEEDPAEYRRVVEVNQIGTFLTLREGAAVLLAQDLGGSIVLISSKNVLGPGADFGAYSSSKAGAHQLGRVAALELASASIHVNMVLPDAVFRCGDNASGLWTEVGPDRAASRGMSADELENFYIQRNLLKQPVSAEDVGRAVLFFATRQTPTTGAVLPVDGGVAAAFPR